MPVRSRIQQHQFESATQEAMVSLLVAAGHLTQRINDLCREHGITHDQYNILRILRGVHPEGHPRCEIASRLMSRSPDVTRLIDRLERAGLVRRGWGPENRRHSIATITAEGLAVLEAIDPGLRAVGQELTAGLSLQELEQLSRTCNRLVG
jgi:DNA-binding MarR family transcriptional regulator